MRLPRVPRGDRAFLACLALIALGVGLFLTLPLAPRFVPLHRLPTTHDWDVEAKPVGLVTPFWVTSMGGYAAAVWLWRRGQRPSWALLLGGVALLHLLALLVPPVASKDVYAYAFYGKVQTDYHANPYLEVPAQHPLHPWYPFWSWRQFGPVYGPPFLLLLRVVAWLSGPSLLAWVVWMKLLLTAAELGGIWLLVRALRPPAPVAAGVAAAAHDPRWPVLLLGWSPLALQSVAMSAHVDALLLLLVAGAVLAHRRGRWLATFLLLVLATVVKVYLGPLAALYGLWLAAGRPPGRRLAAFAGLGALGAALAGLSYLPFASAGARLVTSAVDVSGHFSSGSPPNLVRRLLAAALPAFGVTSTTAAAVGDQAGRAAGLLAIAVATGLLALRVARAPAADPLPLLATWFLAYLLLTPWVFYWHELPLLGLVAVVPWSLTSLGAVAASVTLVPLTGSSHVGVGAAGSPLGDLRDTAVGMLSRYGGTLALLGWGWRRRRRGAASPSTARVDVPVTSTR
jgi:alpha-1,6-mannosyltransferase